MTSHFEPVETTNRVAHSPWPILFVVAQLVGVAAAVATLKLADRISLWPELFALGTFQGQLMLAAVAAVFGPGGAVRRMALSALAVVLGVVLTLGAFPGRLDVDDAAFVSWVLLAVWATLQLPLWIAKWYLRHQARRAAQPEGARTSRWQFRLIHLLGLTLLVSLVLGIGVPLWKGWGSEVGWAVMLYLPWPLLICTTTTLATLYPAFRRNGVRAAAMALFLLAICGGTLMPVGGLHTGGRMPVFLSVMAWSYLWLQGSLLLARAGGYGLADFHRRQAAV